MKKIKINMLSSADKVDGQGVGSAYLEQIALVKEHKNFEILINSKEKSDILHVHTVDVPHYFKMKHHKGVTVCYVHFIPTTLDGSIKLPKPAFIVFKKYVINFYKKADYLVVVNPIFIDDLIKLGIPKERIVYIPNYVSREKFYKLEAKKIKEVKKRYGIDNTSFVVLGAGQVQTRKGVKDFVEVAKKCKDVTFIWAGGFSFGKITDGYEELKKVVENPPKNVKFLGIIPRDNMNDIINASDLLFMPSYNELFPMIILESLNSNKPLLLRDLDLYHNILFDNYLTGKNNNEFVKCINNLKEDKKLYKKYSDKSKETGDFYNKEHVLSMWVEFYNKILKK